MQSILINASNKKGMIVSFFLNGKKWKIYGKKNKNTMKSEVSLIMGENQKIKLEILGEIKDNTFSSDELRLSIKLWSVGIENNIIDITPDETPDETPEEPQQTAWEEVI